MPAASRPGFLDLPISVRESIYAYLLLPHLEEDVTTINYSLSWPYLDNPSNTTWAGPTQIDFCSCPMAGLEHKEDAHIYTRYKCVGPEVHFKSPKEGLWVLQAAHGQLNILRPASGDELQDRPAVAILQTSKQIHNEALPLLYRERDFFFITGPCPRGRYQAYATLQWLRQLNETARANVEILSLLVQPYEEDCNVADVGESYTELAEYIVARVSGFKWLCLDVWDEDVFRATGVLSILFEKAKTGIVVRRRWRSFKVDVFVNKGHFLEKVMGKE